MIFIRLFLVLILITIIVCVSMYWFKSDKRYLRFAWQIIKFLFVLLVLVAVIFSITRIILF
jgi:hypothetical protein